MRQYLFLVLVSLFCDDLRASEFQLYKSDLAPLSESHDGRTYLDLVRNMPQENIRRVYRRRLNLIKKIQPRYPDWIDGYWILSSEAFQMASTLVKPEEHKEALEIFDLGIHAANACLEKTPELVLCKMFKGANIAGAAAVRGIFSSLSQAEFVHDLWTDVVDSDLNYQLTNELTLQGSAHYALGIFYRLVPDSRWISWIFNARGNMEKSISFHRKVIEIDGPSPCGQLMLAASLLCANHKSHEGVSLLKNTQALYSKDLNQKICQKGALDMLEQPDISCGYTAARQQEQEKTVSLKP